ncbi:MAG: hypothetical protein IJ085_01195 [Turicibacter sp.]|nr:hypothetical protein [Turicibacter sp.]
MKFLEFIEASTQVKSIFGSRVKALTEEEYRELTELFVEAGVEEEVSETICSRKRACHGLLSLIALLHEIKQYENTPYRLVKRQEALKEIQQIVSWL